MPILAALGTSSSPPKEVFSGIGDKKDSIVGEKLISETVPSPFLVKCSNFNERRPKKPDCWSEADSRQKRTDDLSEVEIGDSIGISRTLGLSSAHALKSWKIVHAFFPLMQWLQELRNPRTERVNEHSKGWQASQAH
jgi:hypothetical protein